MKNYIIYIGILLAGLLLGWLIFGNSSKNNDAHEHSEIVNNEQMWTCAMHPQIMKTEPGDCPICGMDLIPAEIGADGLSADQFKLTENALVLANVQTTIVGMGSEENGIIKLTGKIIENESLEEIQVSFFSGRIENLNVNYTGEKVNKGQLLATIYSSELYAAQQELITASNLKESQKPLYAAVRNKLKLWKLSDKQIDQIEKTGKPIENFPVYATVSGTVTEKLVAKGDYVAQGQALFKIANLNSVWANFDIYENQIGLFKKGQIIQITTNAYPDKSFTARTDFIDPILNNQTRTVKLRAVLPNNEGIFKPGMFVEGKVANSHSDQERLLIPASAILWTGKRSVIYLKPISNEPIFEMREVVLGNRINDLYEVLEGLNVGDEIVTNGTFTLDAAAQLKGKKSMMNQSGGKTNTGHEDHLGISGPEKRTSRAIINSRKVESPVFQERLSIVFNSYFDLKDALVNDDSALALQNTQKMATSLKSIDHSLINEDNHENWTKTSKELSESLLRLSKQKDLESIRQEFIIVSNQMILMAKNFDASDRPMFIQHCPMANTSKGADWLSLNEVIKNPYFGSSMLSCGEITDTIK
ncbi:efflux RND transporter periplasmic adaptor subunit [Namhaeicola litoreus]|uniref:Efflux RND transporter periplasmic adaptor subunit n=1 Tax=Namhaeicola litoreus TaxID=1052145 RepID=A0ABW3Y1H8_9FLAO